MPNTEIFYGKNEAKIIAGIAIIMMFVHHLFGFASYRLPQNTYLETTIYGISLQRILASCGRLCVPIFAFMSGYALWIQSSKKFGLRAIATKLAHFLSSYWLIMGIFLLYGIIAHEPLPSTQTLLLNTLGINTHSLASYVNVAFAWYVYYFTGFVLISPFLIKIFRKHNKCSTDIILLLVLGIAIWILETISMGGYLYLIPIFFKLLFVSITGLLTAKWHIFERLYSCPVTPRLDILSVTILIVFVLALRPIFVLLGVYYFFTEAIVAGAAIYCFTLLSHKIKFKPLHTSFILLGTYSMNLWFLHGIFFTGNRPLQWILYMPKLPILILIWSFVLLLPFAIVISRIHTYIWTIATSRSTKH